MSRLDWGDGHSIPLPSETSRRAALWAARFTEWIREHDPPQELVERAFQGLLDEERQAVLESVERTIIREY
jgi:hypothetical protein